MNIRGIVILLALGVVLTLALACSSRPDAAGIAAAGLAPAWPASDSGVAAALFPGEKAVSTGPGATIGQASPPAAAVTEPAALVARAGDAMVQSANGQTSGILVSGRGEVSAPPDVAILHLGVQASASAVAVARKEAAAAMASVRAALDERDVPESDIQTRYFRINPRYTSREVTWCPEAQGTGTSGSQPSPTPTPAPMGSMGDETGMVVQEGCFTERESVISRYEVGNNLEVRLRDLDAVGEIIDEVTEAGGDSIRFDGIDFSIDDPSELEDQALAAAVEDAISKAQDVASATGVQLGDLLHISEGAGGQPGFPYFNQRAAYAMADSAVMTRVSGGTLEVSASVQALFGIQGN